MTEEKKSSPKSSSKELDCATEERLQAVVAQLEDNVPQQLSDEHISKYFETKQKLHKLIREDHRDQLEIMKNGRTYALFYILAIGFILLAFIGIIAFVRKESLDKFLELFFAFLGGTGVGSIGTGMLSKYFRNTDEE